MPQDDLDRRRRLLPRGRRFVVAEVVGARVDTDMPVGFRSSWVHNRVVVWVARIPEEVAWRVEQVHRSEWNHILDTNRTCLDC